MVYVCSVNTCGYIGLHLIDSLTVHTATILTFYVHCTGKATGASWLELQVYILYTMGVSVVTGTGVLREYCRCAVGILLACKPSSGQYNCTHKR